MNQVYSTTHRKKPHLTYEERLLIQIRLKDGYKANRIAKELDRAPNTVRNEIKRGTVKLYNGKVSRYKAQTGQETYESNRLKCCRKKSYLEKSEFISYVEKHFHEDGWSLDACVGNALVSGSFSREETLCTKTLYEYVDLGLIGIKNIELPEKLSRKTKKKRIRKNKRKLGRSIEERPEHIDKREEFGHWECDLVLGNKSGKDEVLLTLLERKTRVFLVLRVKNRKASSIMKKIEELKQRFGEHFSDVFKSITTDNGSEFAQLSELEDSTKTKVYFTHPYSSYEKGSNERHNRLLRRFIRKGKRISDYDMQAIINVETWCNSLPRKILDYKTPNELFNKELNIIYAA